jgi:hypothetical protein
VYIRQAPAHPFERMGLTTNACDDRPTKRTKLISSHYLRPHTLLRRRATRTRFNCHPVRVRRERYRDNFRSSRVSMRRRVLPIHHLNRDDGRDGCGRSPQLYITWIGEGRLKHPLPGSGLRINKSAFSTVGRNRLDHVSICCQSEYDWNVDQCFSFSPAACNISSISFS